MASQKSARTPYQWANGSYHTRRQRQGQPRQRSQQTFTPTQAKPAKAGLAPAGASKPAPTLPPDPAYANTVVSNNRNLQIATADYTYGVGQLQQQYGLEDNSNPFSEAALLRENFVRGQRGTENSFAAGGSLYTGAYGRAQGENVRNYSIADDQMRRQYQDQMRTLQRGQLEANANYGSNITAADWQRLISQFGGGR